MNPLILFDYVYYRITYWYENTFDLIIIKEERSIAHLSIFQFFNVITLLFFFIPIDELKNELIIIFILSSLVIFSLNLIRYKKVITYSELAEKWDIEPKKARLIKKVYIICYCILSILLFIYSIFIAF